MLPQNRRIPKKYFPYILKNNKRHNSIHLLLYISPIDPSLKNKQSRFSFSVSKKVCSLAVDRNKYRRRGYSIVSKYTKQVKDGYFCFFSFKKSTTPITFSVLEKEAKELLSLSGVLV